MATSSCPKCGNTHFEMKEASISGANFRYMFVQCSSCGTVVGVTDAINNAQTLLQLGEAIKTIARKVGASVNL